MSLRVPISTLQNAANELLDYTDTSSDIFDRIYNSLQTLEANKDWQGASGAAMAQALADLRTEINGISARLDTLYGQMSSHANSIYNNWPEEIETSSPEVPVDVVAI